MRGSRHTICMNAKHAAALEPDHEEILEWIEAFDEVIDQEGPGQGTRLLDALTRRARQNGVDVPVQLNTPYVNTIPVQEELPYPGDRAMERRIKSLIRWNAMAMVHRQNKKDPGIGGHISTYSSLATLLEVGYNHFFYATYGDEPGDFVYFQGHASPGIYARGYLEGRISQQQIENYRHELRDTPGLSSYPHPWLMPEFCASHRFHGFGPAECHLSGALYALSGEPWADKADAAQSVGVHRRR